VCTIFLENPSAMPSDPGSTAKRLSINFSILPLFQDTTDSLANSFLQISNIQETTTDKRLKSTQKFLTDLRDLLLTIAEMHKIHLPGRLGFEIGFVSGSMFALESNDQLIKHKIFQNWLTDSFTLLMFQTLPIKQAQIEGPPIVIDFDQASSEVTGESNSIRVRDMTFMTSQAIYAFVETGFNYSPESTSLCGISLPTHFAQTILRDIKQGLATTNNMEFLQKGSNYIVEEFEYISIPEKMFTINDNMYLKSYLAGTLSAETRHSPEQIQVEILKPIYTESSVHNLAFLITDLVDNVRFCINIVENVFGGLTSREHQTPFVGDLIPNHQRNFVSEPNQVLVFNVLQSPRHMVVGHLQNMPDQDYLYYRVLAGTVKMENIATIYHQIPLPFFNIVHEAQTVLMSQHDLGYLVRKLHVSIFVHRVIGSDEANLHAFFLGLFHYQHKRTTLIRHGNQDPGILYTVKFQKSPSHPTAKLLSIGFKTGQPTHAFDQQRIDVPADLHKILQIRVNVDHRPTVPPAGQQYRMRYEAAFDNYGPQTTEPVKLDVTCAMP